LKYLCNNEMCVQYNNFSTYFPCCVFHTHHFPSLYPLFCCQGFTLYSVTKGRAGTTLEVDQRQIFCYYFNQHMHWTKHIRKLLPKTPTCFGTGVPAPGGRTIQRTADPTHQSSYCVAFNAVAEILNIKIPKHVKLTTPNLQCCNINSNKSIKNKPFQVLQLFTTAWIMHTNSQIFW
jgi:hypothetical protein